jgi:hypothetical protein
MMSDQSTAAPTTLRITFAGLCLLVRDDTRGRVHFLLPGKGEHAKHHVAQLYLDARHLLGAAAPEGMCAFPLHNVLLDLSFLSAVNNAITTAAVELASLSCITDNPVERNFIDETIPGESVKTRVTINTGRVGWRNRGARWNLGERCRSTRMPTAVEWVIDNVDEAGFTLPLAGLNGNTAETSLRIRPIKGEIHLFIFHSLKETLPVMLPKYPLGEPVAEPGSRPHAPHFSAFYHLVNASATDTVPEFDGEGAAPEQSAEGHEPEAEGAETDHSRHWKARLGFDYGCMLATAHARP